ncbi:hypothetical protein [Streptomyces sp. XY413]|uniref:hypothetical protein n=1 Tax=Streptomyces sp. XY413 TaxID=1519479 RepID=UPI00131EB828|nr:hypothetical protein [Streptomyces sp. XY413]
MAISGHLSTAYGCSAAERVDGALFAACVNDRARQVFYRMDAGIRIIWRSLRGYGLNVHVLDDAARANEALLGEVDYVGISREFVGVCAVEQIVVQFGFRKCCFFGGISFSVGKCRRVARR